jgi:hypothetical protein
MVAFLQSRFYIYFVLSAFAHTDVYDSRMAYSEVEFTVNDCYFVWMKRISTPSSFFFWWRSN